MLNLIIHNQSEEQKQAVEGIMKSKESVFNEAKAGEKCYADSQGWLDTEEWADDAKLKHLEEFAKELSSMSKVCPHFHLSLQSGCDTTLERMNRRYRSAEYKARCELLRKYFGNPALTTDVIVGFPMETEEDFQASYDFVKDIHFYETHIFKYSRRHGTKAAAMSGQLTEAEKAVRSDKMLELHQKRAAEYETSLLGKTLEVLLEEEVEIDGKAYYLGHSREYVKVAVPKTEKYGVNYILAVKVEKTLQPHILQGEEIQVL